MNTKMISRFLIVIFLFFTCSAFTAAQTNWTFVAIDTSYDIWFVDKAVIRKKSGIIVAWIKSVHTDESYTVRLNEWKCAEKMKRLIQYQEYDPNTVLLTSSADPLPWRYVVPDSIESRMYNIICSDSKKRAGTDRNDERYQTS